MIQPYRGSGYYKRSGGIQFRVTILAESLRHFSGLAVGDTAAILSEAKVDTS